MDNSINVFFATNRSYIPYCGIAIYSMLSNASDEYTYNIRILHDGLCEADYSEILGFSFSNAVISFVDVAEYAKDQNYYDGVTEYTSHITKETFYRLLIPELYPTLDKVVYLDSDLIVLDDISKLLQIDLDGKTIGAVYSVEQWCEGNTGMLPNDNPHEWFNAGVMLLDIRQYIKKGYPQKVREALSNTVFDVGDQELLRLICYKDVKYLPFEWNVMWHHLNNCGAGLKEYNRKIYNEAITNPKIVHYSGPIKPWDRPNSVLAEYFWRYAEKTPYGKDLKNQIGISVVIPTYNASSRLDICLDSLWKQTYPFFEIICVDDGSEDNTVEILKKWQKKDKRIMVLQQHHSGAGVARNRGLKEAKGKYVYFLDADDYLSLDALEGMHRKAEENNTDILFFDAFQFDSSNKEKVLVVTKEELLPDKKVFSGTDVKERVFEISYGYVWTKLYRREFLLEQDLTFQKIILAEALSFVYLSMMLAKRIYYWKERPIHYYMDNPLGQSMNSNNNPLSVCAAWLDLKRQMENRNIYSNFERGYINKAAEHSMARFDVLSEIAPAQELFFYLKSSFFSETGIDIRSDEYFYHDFVLKKRNLIMSSDFITYIYEEYLTKRKNLRSIQTGYGEISLDYLPKGCRIVLYGAGTRGKTFRERIKNNSYCDIVLWVDKKISDTDGEICNPQKIISYKDRYDYVLIAVKDKNLADEIRSELVNLGVQEKAILWRQ